jgi:hypothetical protein
MTGLATVVSLLALPGPAPVTLTVRYFDGTEPDHVAHLRCRATTQRADGFLRDAGAATACRRARTIADFLDRAPRKGRICTQIYGGPQRARITGRIGARTIDRRFKRTDGCAIGDWQYAVPLLPRVRAGREP